MFERLVCVDAIPFNKGELFRLNSLSGDFVNTEHDLASEEEILAVAKEADGLLISWRTQLSASLITQLTKLRYIGMFSSTYTNPRQCNVDLEACENAGIVVSTLGQYGDEATAEWVMSRMLLAARSEAPKWRGVVTELFDKQLGIVGLGYVGSHVALRAAAFGMQIVYTGPSVKPMAEVQGWQWKSLDELLSTSDVVTVHVPAGVCALDKQVFEVVRSDALLISSSLGNSVDLAGLDRWLTNNKAAFVCDASVPADQQQFADSHPNAVFDPVVAGMSLETQRRGVAQLIDGVEGFLEGQPIRRHPF